MSVLGRARNAKVVLITLALLAGCESATRGDETYTLYRNSPLDRTMRVHWATFDVSDSTPDANRNQCDMAARLLNANVKEWAKIEAKEYDTTLGFWCERGSYSAKGAVPSSVEQEFPTNVRAELRW